MIKANIFLEGEEAKRTRTERGMKRWLKEMCGLDFMLFAVPKGESLAKLAIHALVVQQVRLPWETYQHVVGDDGIERHLHQRFHHRSIR